jgi:hypothetical protein
MNLIKQITCLKNISKRFFSNQNNRDVMLRRAALFVEEQNRQVFILLNLEDFDMKKYSVPTMRS